MVLHGRVVKQRDDGDDGRQDCGDQVAPTPKSLLTHRPGSLRDNMERKSTISQLTEETHKFQNVVSSLGEALRGDAQTAEKAWRVKVLINSAQGSDMTLWTKLYEFEKTLLLSDFSNSSTTSQDELREAQTACMKLHRDFKRSHKALLMCLALADESSPTYEKSNPMGQAMGWTGLKADEHNYLSERSRIRQRSPQPVYTTFREIKTNEVFVFDERDDFKGPPRGAGRARRNFDPSIDDSQCFRRRGFLCSAMGFVDDDQSTQESVTYYNRWYKQLAEDFSSLKTLGCGDTEDADETSSARVGQIVTFS